jgi:hypothetical protein
VLFYNLVILFSTIYHGHKVQTYSTIYEFKLRNSIEMVLERVYHYYPLKDSEAQIRLLTLMPAENLDSGMIAGAIHRFYLRDVPTYEALSYE